MKNISDNTMKKYTEIEWLIIKNLRNKIVHDYEGINLSFIWDIITDDLKPLKESLQNILNIEENVDE